MKDIYNLIDIYKTKKCKCYCITEDFCSIQDYCKSIAHVSQYKKFKDLLHKHVSKILKLYYIRKLL
jgi:hypothetical protein